MTVAVPCGLHGPEPELDDCYETAEHVSALNGRLICLLSDAHEGPHFDPVDGHWQLAELDGVEHVQLSRCQKVVTAQ